MSSDYEQMCIGQDLLDAARGLPPGVEKVEQAGAATPPAPYMAGHARYQEEALVGDDGSPRALEAYIEGARMQLAQAKSDFDRIKVRDVALAAAAAATILKRKDIVVTARELVLDATWAVKEANPPQAGAAEKPWELIPRFLRRSCATAGAPSAASPRRTSRG